MASRSKKVKKKEKEREEDTAYSSSWSNSPKREQVTSWPEGINYQKKRDISSLRRHQSYLVWDRKRYFSKGLETGRRFAGRSRRPRQSGLGTLREKQKFLRTLERRFQTGQKGGGKRGKKVKKRGTFSRF